MSTEEIKDPHKFSEMLASDEIVNAGTTVRRQMDQMAELERERNALLLEMAELKSRLAHYQADETRVLRILKDANKRGQSASFFRHSLTRIEQVLLKERRAA